MTSRPPFQLPAWVGSPDLAEAGRRTVEYDVAAGRTIKALRDRIVIEALAILSDRLELEPNQTEIAEDHDHLHDLYGGMVDLTVPAERFHFDWHLRRAIQSLGQAGPNPFLRLRNLETAWKNLSTAAGESSLSLIDLSQCCCGLGHQTPTMGNTYGL